MSLVDKRIEEYKHAKELNDNKILNYIPFKYRNPLSCTAAVNMEHKLTECAVNMMLYSNKEIGGS